jgi:hypothetical protein
MARFGGNSLEVGEKNVKPTFGLLKHTRKRKKRRGCWTEDTSTFTCLITFWTLFDL